MDQPPGLHCRYALALVAVALVACDGDAPRRLDQIFPPGAKQASAKLVGRNDSAADGLVAFAQKGDKVTVTALVSELAIGQHSMHIHLTGNCSSPNAASAGPVWNVPGASNGGRARTGDLPELVANANGQATLSANVSGLTVGDGGPTDIVGHSVVVQDRLNPDPIVEFGVRNGWVACGVIQK